jgi:hypothetical protein
MDKYMTYCLLYFNMIDMTYCLFLFDYFYLLNRPAPDLSVTDLLHNALDIALLNYAQGK